MVVHMLGDEMPRNSKEYKSQKRTSHFASRWAMGLWMLDDWNAQPLTPELTYQLFQRCRHALVGELLYFTLAP